MSEQNPTVIRLKNYIDSELSSLDANKCLMSIMYQDLVEHELGFKFQWQDFKSAMKLVESASFDLEFWYKSDLSDSPQIIATARAR